MRRRNSTTRHRVIDGRVQRKNRAALTPNVFNTEFVAPVIEREKPGRGYKHLLLKRDIDRFVRLLPDWAELSSGLNAILLATGEDDVNGWHTPGVVAVCAWERELWTDVDPAHHEEHARLWQRLGVRVRKMKSSGGAFVRVEWTERQAAAYQLLHILLHELGHHHDRMTTQSRAGAARGESYAEEYANRYAEVIWDRYMREFGAP